MIQVLVDECTRRFGPHTVFSGSGKAVIDAKSFSLIAHMRTRTNFRGTNLGSRVLKRNKEGIRRNKSASMFKGRTLRQRILMPKLILGTKFTNEKGNEWVWDEYVSNEYMSRERDKQEQGWIQASKKCRTESGGCSSSSCSCSTMLSTTK
jgi:hypothetical protein